MRNLNPTNEEQRKTATNHLLDRVSWSDTSDYMSDFAITRTRQVSDDMTVSKAMVEAVILASGGHELVGIGGGGSSYITQLTNWDGTKKKGNGLGR